MKGWLVAIAAVLLVAMGAAACQQWNDAKHARAIAATLEAKRDSAVAGREAAERRLALLRKNVERRDSIHTDSIVSARREMIRAISRARLAEDTLRIVLAEAYPDLLEQLDTLVASHALERGAWKIERRQWESRVSDLRLVIDGQDALIKDLGFEVSAWQKLSKHWQKEAGRRDFSFLGIQMDITCGPGLMVGLVSPAATPGFAVGVGCLVGR